MTVPTATNDTSPTLLSEVFQAGDTFEEFRRRLPADSPGRLDLEKPVVLAGAELAFRGVTDLRVLARVEDWCKDSRDALPVLDALIAMSPRSGLRVVRRNEHPDLMKATGHAHDHFQHLHRLLQARGRPITEVQLLLMRANAAMAKFEALVLSLDDEEFEATGPQEGDWSAAQVLEHIISNERAYRDNIVEGLAHPKDGVQVLDVDPDA